MGKTRGMNKHQKAAHRPGERKISREQVAELLVLAGSDEADERLVAAQLLCPCHVRGRIPAVWDALYRMMEDTDRRVRFAAWHTLEDGGLPSEPEALALLERIFVNETDTKIRTFATLIIGPALAERNRRETTRLNLLSRPVPRQRGKCDFCGCSDVAVERDLDTMIPTADLPRPALVCERCAQNSA